MAQNSWSYPDYSQEHLVQVLPTPRPRVALRPTPNLETQELYETMKRAEAQLPLGERIRIQEDHGTDTGQNDRLQPPTPSQATDMSRSSSCRSATPSLNYRPRAVDIEKLVEEEQRLGAGMHIGVKRRRPGRHGPLNDYAKARAALLRKLGACGPCHDRKVKCEHHDLSLFEDRHRAAKRGTPPAFEPPSPANAYQPTQVRLSENQDLRFVGGNENVTTPMPRIPPYPSTSGGGLVGTTDDFNRELVEIANRSPFSPAPSASAVAPLYNIGLRARQPSLHLIPPTMPATNPVAVQETDDQVQYLPIGRLVGLQWECQWAHGSDASLCSGEGDVCGHRFGAVANLAGHFRAVHAPFRDAKVPFLFRCRQCQFLWFFMRGSCRQCSSSSGFEHWYYGDVAIPGSATSPQSSVRITSRDASPMKPSPGLSNFNSSHPGAGSGSNSAGSGSPMNWGGGFYGGGGGQQYWAAGSGPHSDGAEKLGTGVDWDRDRDDEPLVVSPTPLTLSQSLNSSVSSGLAHTALPYALTLYLFYLACTESPAPHAFLGGGGGRASARPVLAFAPILAAAQNHVQLCALLCISIVVMGMLLFKHVWYRPAQLPEEISHERCSMCEDVVDNPRTSVDEAPYKSLASDGLAAQHAAAVR